MSIGLNYLTYLEGRHLLQIIRRRNIEVIETTIILEYLQKNNIIMADGE